MGVERPTRCSRGWRRARPQAVWCVLSPALRRRQWLSRASRRSRGARRDHRLDRAVAVLQCSAGVPSDVDGAPGLFGYWAFGTPCRVRFTRTAICNSVYRLRVKRPVASTSFVGFWVPVKESGFGSFLRHHGCTGRLLLGGFGCRNRESFSTVPRRNRFVQGLERRQCAALRSARALATGDHARRLEIRNGGTSDAAGATPPCCAR